MPDSGYSGNKNAFKLVKKFERIVLYEHRKKGKILRGGYKRIERQQPTEVEPPTLLPLVDP
jgi:hypothetical protein